MTGSFNTDIWWILLGQACIWVSVGLLGLRLLRALRPNTGLLYVTVTVMDILFGVTGLILFLFHLVSPWWLRECLINWILGLLMLADTILFRER